MLVLIVTVVAIAVQIVIVSVTFGAWLQLSPTLKSLSGPTYAEVQQRVLGRLKAFMPFVLLAALVVATLDAVVMRREGDVPFDLALTALSCVIAFLYVTIRYELPINQEIDRWAPDRPPADWAAKRERWERWHTVRAFLSIAALAAFIAAAIDLPGIGS